MLDLLKKIGVPATMAAVIAVLVLVTPLMFTVDERYAKHSEVEKMVSKIQQDNERLARELAEVVGTQKFMVSFINAGKIPGQSHTSTFEDLSDSNFIRVGFFQDFKDFLAQRKKAEALKGPEQPASAPEPAIVAPAPPPQAPAPKNWKELGERIDVQQQRLYKN